MVVDLGLTPAGVTPVGVGGSGYEGTGPAETPLWTQRTAVQAGRVDAAPPGTSSLGGRTEPIARLEETPGALAAT